MKSVPPENSPFYYFLNILYLVHKLLKFIYEKKNNFSAAIFSDLLIYLICYFSVANDMVTRDKNIKIDVFLLIVYHNCCTQQ